jgi:predicted acylesterase/phospholipase RssA
MPPVSDDTTMTRFTTLRQLDLSAINTLVFAGGGNRCWWQGGIMQLWQDKGWPLPKTLIGTSAGAAIAASSLTLGPEHALQACHHLYANNERLFRWKTEQGRWLQFAHQHIYPAWIESFVNESTLAQLQGTSSRLLVAVTQPSRWLGLLGSVAAGTLAYLVNKKISHSIHPQLPKFLGLKQAFYNLGQCHQAQAMQSLLRAAAAAPPFMSPLKLDGSWAFDGGYTDNAPIPAQTQKEKLATLVLLTRHYPKLPALFRWQGRQYWQPSQKVPVSTWDCRPKTTVSEAFSLGLQDAQGMLRYPQLISAA